MASSDPSKRHRPGPWPPAPESASAMPPSSWAKRTGFRPKFSGEANANANDSGSILVPSQPKPKESDANIDLEAGRVRPGPTANGEPASLPPRPTPEKDKEQSVRKRRDSDGGGGGTLAAPGTKTSGANGQAAPPATAATGEAGNRRVYRNEEAVDVLPQPLADDDGFVSRHSHMKYELRDTPGLGELYLIV